eukprot:m.58566 g.58566  ORF g.58566 m.58566 type:complete len:518 (+) comp11270_c0_seq2:230-1783(+)
MRQSNSLWCVVIVGAVFLVVAGAVVALGNEEEGNRGELNQNVHAQKDDNNKFNAFVESDCKLCGVVDDCFCSYKEVTSWNTQEFFPMLSQLVQSRFFKFFYVSLYGECPIWESGEEDGLCMSPTCAVQECKDTTSLPLFNEDSRTVISYNDFSCMNLNAINNTVTTKEQSDLASKRQQDILDRSNFCVADELVFPKEEMEYVNLIDNPERFTGYSGPSASRIWKAVYNSNCFTKGTSPSPSSASSSPSSSASSSFTSPSLPPSISSLDMLWSDNVVDTALETDEIISLNDEDLEDMCLEQRVFYRLLSGLHASISIHLSYKWLDVETNEFKPNLTEFRRRFADSSTNNQGSRWLKNMYFTYLTVLKAITKAEKLWESYHFSTGDTDEEKEIKAMVLQLIEGAKKYSDLAIDEDLLFQSKDRLELLHETKEHIKKITNIMNCVGCMKCRLWGKLQTRGLATAMRLLLGNKIQTDQVAFELGRNDIVALFNLWERLASSITYLQRFESLSPTPLVQLDD